MADIILVKNDIVNNQENLLVACLYVPGNGYYIFSEVVWPYIPNKSKVQDWVNAVGTSDVFHAEDMACYLYESKLAVPLARNTDYPRDSCIYILVKYHHIG